MTAIFTIGVGYSRENAVEGENREKKQGIDKRIVKNSENCRKDKGNRAAEERKGLYINFRFYHIKHGKQKQRKIGDGKADIKAAEKREGNKEYRAYKGNNCENRIARLPSGRLP